MDAFIALADPHRRRMVELLAHGSRSAGEIAARFPISAPAVSQHLKALRETRLVKVEVRGQQRIYTLAPDGFREIDEWLLRNIRFWSHRLDRLGEAMARAALPGAGSVPIPAKPPAAAANLTRSSARRRSRRPAAAKLQPRTKRGESHD
jgi:DNA-binding transcriptional ArsR family regulator